jgi:hypothetical protein
VLVQIVKSGIVYFQHLNAPTSHHLISPPHPRPTHDSVKLLLCNPPAHASPAIRLENHVLDLLVVDLGLKHRGYALQVRKRDGPPVAPAREQLKRLLDFAQVRVARLVPRVVLQRADRDERLVGRVPFVVRIEDRNEIREFGALGLDV